MKNVIAEVKLTYNTNVKASEREKITCSLDASKILIPFYNGIIEHREYAFALLLNRGNKVLGVMKLSEGGVSGTVIDSKILFQAAILANASGIILSHNHPSGHAKPSAADETLTKKLVKAGELLDIQILDHLILTDETFLSMADEGLM